MKTKQEIYNDTREMVNMQDKENYLAYYKVFFLLPLVIVDPTQNKTLYTTKKRMEIYTYKHYSL